MEKTHTEQSEYNEMTQSITSIPDKDSIEERYNKLRGLAIKLKKKVADLTEQLQNKEAEKQKIISEKDDLHNKFIQITENAKKLQTIQMEYDKVQDKMEQCKLENKKLLKNVETLVSQNTSLKESLFQEKDAVSSLTSKIELLNKEKANLESTNKRSIDEIKKLKNEIKAQLVIREQKDKDFEEMKATLEAEINAHKNTKTQLDTLKQEHNSNNVLSLEVENYEKSIKEMKAKYLEETSKRETAEKAIEKHLDQIVALNTQISELQNDNFERKKEIINLQQMYDIEKSNNLELCEQVKNNQLKLDDFNKQMKVLELEKKNFLEQIEKLTKEKSEILKEMHFDKENKDKLLKELTSEVSRLNEQLEQNKQEMDNLREEFESYKLRAQCVLQTSENSSKLGQSKGVKIVLLEEELEYTKFENNILQEKFDSCKQKVESLTNDIAIMKEERDHALEIRKDLNEKLTHLRQEYRLLMEQNKEQEKKIQQIYAEQKKLIEQLHNQYKSEINDLKEQHQNEILKLKTDYEKIAITNSSKGDDKVHENHVESTFYSRIPAPLIEREECEGSESIDSYSLMSANDERHRKHSLMPLDELLNSTDDFENNERKSYPAKVSRQELEAYEHRVKHLTALLADTERDIAKLTQQNELLKEDIRRQQRSVEREQHANNFEYLKNVVFKFITLKNGDERTHLIPVLTTILKLSPEEIHKVNDVAGVSGRGWLPGISGWNH